MSSALGIVLLLASQTTAEADRTIALEIRPTGDPQIAVWLEDAQGTFVDTLMVTKLTATFGLGNRPGRPDFGGGVFWPYGRREMVLPIWAHRHGVKYPRLVFQDCREDSLGWHERHSSEEPYYCRPVTPQEELDARSRVDGLSCPTMRFSSDKGIPLDQVDQSIPLCRSLLDRYSSTESVYPPRNDLNRIEPGRDWAGVEQLETMNNLDLVSEATPAADDLYHLVRGLPSGLASGRYYVLVEVNQAFDANEHHDYDFFIDPMLQNYGVRVAGQPSVLWRVPVDIGEGASEGFASEYVGYGSPDGKDGLLREPDNTITRGIEGTGAGRLLTIQGDGATYKIKVEVSGRRAPGEEDPCPDPVPPISVVESSETSDDWRYIDLLVELNAAEADTFYEVVYRNGHDSIVTEGDFNAANPGMTAEPGAGTEALSLRLTMSREQARYTVAIRSKNTCGKESAFVTTNVATERRETQTVDACFVATAAHGSDYAQEVASLRQFRDDVLVPTDSGLAAVELYYYLSPPVADAIRESGTLRAATRFALKPLVWLSERF